MLVRAMGSALSSIMQERVLFLFFSSSLPVGAPRGLSMLQPREVSFVPV